ncbi:MAG: GGDEF domain-containing protein [Candidatus Zixiibacteriota bacterium]
MLDQNFITATLVVLVVALAFLLIFRIRHEKKYLSIIKNMNLEEFSEFLKTNSVEGTILQVAGKVSDLLKNVFECQRIVFLRKQRNFLELNYYHGINRFNRSDFRIKFSDELAVLFKTTFLPQKLLRLKEQIPGTVYERLESMGFDVYFPIFWRENLYGVYFIRSTFETRTPSFNLLLAALAQSLSAAYHIKWHESRYSKLEQKIQQTRPAPRVTREVTGFTGMNILKLVKHRNSETIVPKIIDALAKDLDLNQVAFIYESRQREILNIIKQGVTGGLETPSSEAFKTCLAKLGQNGYRSLDEFAIDDCGAEILNQNLKKAGLRFVMPFSLNSRQAGLLAWSGGGEPQATVARLVLAQPQAGYLIENAESYEKIEEMSYTDNLTGLANHRYFSKRLNEEIDRAKRYRRSLALIIFDMDDLKSINDNYGHLAGDATLQRLGQILRSSIRAIDIIARYGGDEFCVIMPEADQATCKRFMNRLQLKISNSKFRINELDRDLNCTISQGGAIFPDHADNAEKLIFSADMALLQAKEAGRNKFLLFGEKEAVLE